MNDDTKITDIIKWIGIACLVAVPIYLISKHFKQQQENLTDYDDENIFASELE